MKAYWQQEDNIGDKLTPYILKRLFNIDCEFSKGKGKLLGVGSILSHADKGDYIWGSGMISPRHLPMSNELNIWALRGPLTKKCLEDFGVKIPEPVVYGDPAILLPLIYSPKKLKMVKTGIVPHYTDLEEAQERYNEQEQKGEVRIIDPRLPIEQFIDEISACGYIYSSSLHGLIIADAYGISNERVVFGDKLVGGDFKFNDYELSKDHINIKKLVEAFNIEKIKLC